MCLFILLIFHSEIIEVNIQTQLTKQQSYTDVFYWEWMQLILYCNINMSVNTSVWVFLKHWLERL